MKDGQISHHLWHIAKSLEPLTTYAEFQDREIPRETLKELDKLVAHIKLNY